MAAIYRKLFAGLCELYSKEEEATQAKLQRMRQLSMGELGVREDCRCHPQVAIGLLAQLSSIPTVALQLAQLEDVSRALTAAVKEAGQAMAEEAQTAGGDSGERRKRDTVLSAEDMIPLTLYVVLQSGLQHIQAHLQLLHHFAPSRQVGGIDHLQVHLANFQAACHLIDSGRTGMEEAPGGGGDAAVEPHGGHRLRDGLQEGEIEEASTSSGPGWPSSLASAIPPSSSSTASSRAPHSRALSTSASLGSLSSSHPRHRSRLFVPSAAAASAVLCPQRRRRPTASAARSSPLLPTSSRTRRLLHPPLRRHRSRTQQPPHSSPRHPPQRTLCSHSGPTNSSAQPQPQLSSLGSSHPPSSSTNPFDSPVRDGGGAGHFPFPLQPSAPSLLCRSPSTLRAPRSVYQRPSPLPCSPPLSPPLSAVALRPPLCFLAPSERPQESERTGRRWTRSITTRRGWETSSAT